jgi:RNA polymerase primary sigma factor
MLRSLYKTVHDLNERLEAIERRLAAAMDVTAEVHGNQLPLTSASLSNWLAQSRFPFHRELIRAAQRELRQLEAVAGTDSQNLRKAHADAAAAWHRYQRAWNQLVEANLRLVVSIARHFVRDGITLADLVQEGNLGLFRASEKFDYRLGYRFSTYASFWIRQAMSRALPKQGRLITVPRYMYDHIARLSALTVSLQQKLARNPSMVELIDAASLPSDTVLTALGADQSVLSLDWPASEQESTGLYDKLADQHQHDPSDSLNDQQVAERVAELLKALPEREALILRLHYGIGGSAPITLEQIATILGITRERVRQLEVHALKVLRSTDASELLESLAD